MVALLRYGGRKRRLLPHLPEEQVVYLAMRDMNIARLTADDLPLFNGIMSDIFPGVSIPVVDYVEMNQAITAEFVSKGLQVRRLFNIRSQKLYNYLSFSTIVITT